MCCCVGVELEVSLGEGQSSILAEVVVVVHLGRKKWLPNFWEVCRIHSVSVPRVERVL